MIKLALVDDHIVTRKGIRTIIEMHHEIRVILEASNGKELLQSLSKTDNHPDIILLDISMPVMNGFDTIEVLQTRHPSIKVIIFSLLGEEDTVIHMIRKGACGYIQKNTDPLQLASIINTVQTTGFYIGDLVKKDYFQNNLQGKRKGNFLGKNVLSPKELEFIRLSSTNLNYKEIAEKMEVSPKTIENYRDSLFQKLEIKNRAALALYAFKNGLIDNFTS